MAKPNPTMILRACEIMGNCAPSRVLLIGRDADDREAAHRAGATYLHYRLLFDDHWLKLQSIVTGQTQMLLDDIIERSRAPAIERFSGSAAKDKGNDDENDGPLETL